MIFEPLENRRLLAHYFVAPTGSDAAAGSESAPFRTLQQAAVKLTAGDSVTVRPGKYAGFTMGWDAPQNGSADQPITWSADPGATIVSRNKSTADGINLEACSYIVLDGFVINNDNGTGGIDRAGIRAVNGNGIVIKNVTASDNGTWGIYAGHADNLTIENCTTSNNNAFKPEGWNHHGIYVANSSQAPVIRDNTVNDNYGNGIHLNGDASQGGAGIIRGAVIENNKIANNGIRGGSGINCDGIQDSKIINNDLRNNHAKGISLYRIDAADGAKNNLVENNNIVMADDAWAALNIKNGSTGATIRNNALASPKLALNVASDSLEALKSDNNKFAGSLSLDDGDTWIDIAKWRKATKQDEHSTQTNKPTTRRAAAHWLAVRAPLIAIVALAALIARWFLKRRNLHTWIGAYIRQTPRRLRKRPRDIHVILAIADHYEPFNGKVARHIADDRVHNWVTRYPELFDQFRDSDNRPPRHTFFYPIEQYDEQHVESIARLCREGFGEIELHLHHDHDTAENLRRLLEEAKQIFSQRHNLLARDRETGEIKYAFVHGNWALCNSHPHGKHCGVDNELEILRDTGCYSDFTMPAAPDPCQTRKINSIYYATENPNQGVDVAAIREGEAPAEPSSPRRGSPGGSPSQQGLMLIQGPLVLNCRTMKIENACLQQSQPPTMDRLELWLKAHVQVPTRPDWFFVKLHTHGAPEVNQQVLLGQPMVDFHRALAERAAGDAHFHYHYVTAREMYNLIRAAEVNHTGDINSARDFELLGPEPVAWASRPCSASNKCMPEQVVLR